MLFFFLIFLVVLFVLVSLLKSVKLLIDPFDEISRATCSEILLQYRVSIQVYINDWQILQFSTFQQRLFIFIEQIVIYVILVDIDCQKLQCVVLNTYSLHLPSYVLVKVNFFVKVLRSFYKRWPKELAITAIHSCN